MSDLRFFADLMEEAIEGERRLRHIRTIEMNATAYFNQCSLLRDQALPRGAAISPQFHAATGGMNACRIIVGSGFK
jgi:hypothetical protein